MDFKVIDSKTCFEGFIVDIRKDKIEFENGLQADRELVVKHHEAAAVIAVDNDGKLLMVKQYRYGTGFEMLEIPAGLMDPGEDHETCAARELQEETGMKAKQLTRLFDYYATPGYCTEKIVFYLAQDLEPAEQHLDADEFLTVHKVDIEEAIQMVSDGRITDGKTIAAVFAVKTRFKMD